MNGLANKNILITAHKESAKRFKKIVTDNDGTAVLFPLLKLVTLEINQQKKTSLQNINQYAWILFTSANAVRLLAKQIPNITQSSGPRIITIGRHTYAVAKEQGWSNILIAEEARAEGVVETLLKEGLTASQRVLFPCAKSARRYIPDYLNRIGVSVEIIHLYDVLQNSSITKNSLIERLKNHEIDAVTFSSPSAVDCFFRLIPKTEWLFLNRRPVICAIGQTTASALNKIELKADVIPPKASKEKMIDSLAHFFMNHVNYTA